MAAPQSEIRYLNPFPVIFIQIRFMGNSVSFSQDISMLLKHSRNKGKTTIKNLFMGITKSLITCHEEQETASRSFFQVSLFF